jgi:hypothetical protein
MDKVRSMLADPPPESRPESMFPALDADETADMKSSPESMTWQSF